MGAISVAKTALLWINDGLMAVFFFLMGVALKREFLSAINGYGTHHTAGIKMRRQR